MFKKKGVVTYLPSMYVVNKFRSKTAALLTIKYLVEKGILGIDLELTEIIWEKHV